MASIIFFFSSRRRHTRCLSDWSSDVCSSDLFAASKLPAAGQIVSGTYKPSQNGDVSFPLTNTPAGPYGTNFAMSFNGTNANGNWSLYVFDGSPGDQGIILGGWSIAIATGTPVNDIVDLAVSGVGTPNPV